MLDRRWLDRLSHASGLDLRIYRPAHVAGRVHDALDRLAGGDVDELHRRLIVDEEARRRFRRSVAISVTGLFRDPAQFEVLEGELRRSVPTPRMRVWSAGCADGSELWSVAAVLERVGALEGAILLGSDVLDENVARARRFGPEQEGRLPRLPASARMRFERRDLVNDGAPVGRWDLILCRNVAIYLAPPARSALHAMLAASLAPGGLLVLGRSERLTDARTLGLRLVAPHAYRSAA